MNLHHAQQRSQPGRALRGTWRHTARSWVTRYGAMLTSLDAPTRLSLRTHPLHAALRSNVVLITKLDPAIRIAHTLTEVLRDRSLDRDRSLALALALALDLALIRSRSRDGPPNRDLHPQPATTLPGAALTW